MIDSMPISMNYFDRNPGSPVANQGEGKGVPAQGKNNKP